MKFRWTQKELGTTPNIEFAKQILTERAIGLNHYSPLAKKTQATIKLLEYLFEVSKQDTKALNKSDLKGIVERLKGR